MSDIERESTELRVLVLAPTTKDAALTQSIFDRAGIECLCCHHIEELCALLDAGAGAVILPEEALDRERQGLLEWIGRQPPWSDLPVLILARPGADSAAIGQAMELLGNVTVLERPTRVAALVSAVRASLQARRKQYQIRDYIDERERTIEAQALLAAIVESSDDAIISKTLNGQILSWNAGAARLFGYTAAEAIGQSITMLIPPERAEEEPKLLGRLRRGERIEHFETVRVTKDGRRLEISLTVSPIRDSEGKIIAASKVARDITLQKRVEAELRDADRRKDEFLATLAHELRGPLAPIFNMLEIAKRCNGETDADLLRQARDTMERQLAHLVRLVDDLLDVSRISRDKLELRKGRIELASVIHHVIEASEPMVRAAGQELSLVLSPDPIHLYADPVRLAQVISNLLTNASKYTRPGGRIAIIVEPEEKSVLLRVKDTGVGIPTDMLQDVFEMFTQVRQAQPLSQGGLGIGLTLVKRLVEMHGGTVTAHSNGVGTGSEFVIRLPVLTEQAPLPQTPRPSTDAPAAIGARNILVVDDNKDTALSLARLLSLSGHRTQVAHDGQEALERAQTFDPDIILLDVGLPRLNGYDACRAIRRLPRGPEMRIIALTGWGQEEDKRKTQQAGFDFHMVKPINYKTLTDLLFNPQPAEA